ncbi:hypothetical protein E2C01_078492 [Portunus trituberculatus]|uniref:Uncharacterized protein n=1 Tax=Portunus trituberculatus TaxID=210409 RepID=A0A5B7IQB5_PORTR|nr:hypothetical protein [Portunus trituberculatus]
MVPAAANTVAGPGKSAHACTPRVVESLALASGAWRSGGKDVYWRYGCVQLGRISSLCGVLLVVVLL